MSRVRTRRLKDAQDADVPAEGSVPDACAGSAEDNTSVVFRVMRLVSAVAENSGQLSVAELATVTQLPKPTVHRLCQQLESGGYFLRDLASRRYGVGHRLWSLGLNVVNAGVQPERRAILQRLVNEIGETCNLSMRLHDRSIYVDRVESGWPLRLNLEPGSLVPLHCTASGKLFLAAMVRARRQRLLEITGMTKHTPNTITNVEGMEREIKLIKERGYSIDKEEFIEGLVALAVPVLNAQGQTVAGIACHGPRSRLSVETALSHLPLLRRAAESLRMTLPQMDGEGDDQPKRAKPPRRAPSRKGK
ncbi:MAG TPA: IclR family transcriptional regulator [Hyphomicrobiaceae bacterium]|nr:IclR family transcriptional regulator [Hyphomicrobiaceae bacterium]